jgi:hypothetical protein
MNQFATGLLATDFLEYRMPPFVGRGWKVTYRVDPRRQHHIVLGNKVVFAKEIVIHAGNQILAQKAIGLIHSALVLLWNDPLIADHSWIVEDLVAQRTAIKLGRKPLFQVSTNELPIACLIAAKASFKRQFTYALHKFLLSTQIYAPDVRSLDPSEGVHHRLSRFPEDHVRFSYAIIAAYSVIEELGLEPRVFPPKHPSTMVAGTWDPYLKAHLETRLIKAGVDLNDKVLWQLRGPRTRIERDRPPRTIAKQTWARGFIRDAKVEVVDALANASWLRSRVSSHRFSTKVSALSVYDVSNVQHLARRLLLEQAGYWRYHRSTQTKLGARKPKKD